MNDTYTVKIDGSTILDFEAFHKVFTEKFGFFDGYGENMDAWIDCMGDLHKETGMMKVLLPASTALILEIINTDLIESANPEIVETLSACTASVNNRIKDMNETYAPIYLLLWARES